MNSNLISVTCKNQNLHELKGTIY